MKKPSNLQESAKNRPKIQKSRKSPKKDKHRKAPTNHTNKKITKHPTKPKTTKRPKQKPSNPPKKLHQPLIEQLSPDLTRQNTNPNPPTNKPNNTQQQKDPPKITSNQQKNLIHLEVEGLPDISLTINATTSKGQIKGATTKLLLPQPTNRQSKQLAWKISKIIS